MTDVIWRRALQFECIRPSFGRIRRYKQSEYSRMFTWDGSYIPKECIHVNIDALLNCRSFTNSLDNPNHALMNDGLYEFALNKSIGNDNCLIYKDISFPVKIFDTESKYDSLICCGQLIDVPTGCYRDILLISTAQFGYKEAYVSLTYADGETEKIEFTVSDWCERVLRDEYIIHYAYGCRQLGWGGNVIKGDSIPCQTRR